MGASSDANPPAPSQRVRIDSPRPTAAPPPSAPRPPTPPVSAATTDDWTPGRAKWIAAGALAGAAVVGLIWSITSRIPGPLSLTPASPALASSDSDRTYPAPAPPVLAPPAPPAGSSPPPSSPAPSTDSGREQPAARPVQPASAPVPSPPRAESPSALTPAPAKVNINSATAAELEALPGIGPALAQRIVADRTSRGPFRSVNDLDRVRGIGPKIVESLRELVTVN